MEHDWRMWEDNACGNARLKHFTHIMKGEISPYLDNSKQSAYFCKARVGDKWGVCGAAEMIVCQICNTESKCIWNHVIAHCPATEDRRRAAKKKWSQHTHENTLLDWSCTLLMREDHESAQVVGGLIGEWSMKMKKAQGLT
jgi:hypothetical protein